MTYKTYDIEFLFDGTDFQLRIEPQQLKKREIRGLRFSRSIDQIPPNEIQASIRGALGTKLRLEGAIRVEDFKQPITDTSQIITYGKALFQKLFPGIQDKTHIGDFVEINASNDYPTHVRINDELLRSKGFQIPWEALHFEDPGSKPLAIDPEVAISRLLPGKNPFGPTVEIEDSIRVLIFSSRPEGEGEVEAIDEVNAIISELCDDLHQELGDEFRSAFSVKQIDQSNREKLRSTLSEFKPHIVHYIGHSDFGDDGTGVLIFHDSEDSDAKDPVSTADFVDIFSENRPILILLNSCLSAISGNQPYTGIAKSLIASGIPYVVAMQNYITNKSAIKFSTAFYRSLEGNSPVWAAVSAGRGDIKAQKKPYRFEYITPVLYTHPSPPEVIVPKNIGDRDANWFSSFITAMGGTGQILVVFGLFQGILAGLSQTLLKKIAPALYVLMGSALLAFLIGVAINARRKRKTAHNERKSNSTKPKSPTPIIFPWRRRFWILAGIFVFTLLAVSGYVLRLNMIEPQPMLACWDGSEPEDLGDCPVAPPEMRTCWDGSTLSINEACPARPQVCASIFDPVCAKKIVDCETTPCPTQPKTFASGCEAQSNGYMILHRGVCPNPQQYICWDGSTADNETLCPPEPVQTQTCPVDLKSQHIPPVRWNRCKCKLAGMGLSSRIYLTARWHLCENSHVGMGQWLTTIPYVLQSRRRLRIYASALNNKKSFIMSMIVVSRPKPA